MTAVSEITTTVDVTYQFNTRLAVMEARLDALVETIKETALLRDRALVMQAGEYERRLGDLNHAHEKQREDQATYMPRELYDADKKEVRLWQGSTDRTLTEMKSTLDSLHSDIAQILAMAQANGTSIVRIDNTMAEERGARTAQARTFTVVVAIMGIGFTALTLLLNFGPFVTK